MRRKVLSILALTILVASTLIGCSGASPTDSTLTILSITQGTVLVMKTGTDSWTEAEAGMSLQVGDTIKTGDDSGAEITFFDGSTIELEAGTQIEITSLDSSPDTGTKTITLVQTIGTTISRVTKLLDPASSYAIETPSGVAAVRGSVMIVRIVFDDPNYEDGTVLITCVEGDIWAIWNGVELHIPEGYTCVIRPNQLPELIPLNEPPVAISDSVVTDADSPVTVDAPGVLNNDADPDGDPLAVTALNTSGTLGAVTAWDADGSFTYDPNGQFEYLQAGNSTSDSFTYMVSDGHGGTDTATVTVIINGVYEPPPYYPPIYYPPVYYPPVNYPPVAVDDAATTDEDNPVSVAAPGVLVNDTDPDVGDTLTVTAVHASGTVGTVTAWGPDGSFTYDPNGQFEYLSAGNSTTDTFTYTVSDGHGGTDVATVTITIDGVNDTPGNGPPVAVDNSATTPQDTPVTIDILGNDSDPDGDTLTVVSVTQGHNGTVASNGNDVTYTPDPGFTGTDSFNYTVSDGNGGTGTATVTVTVTGAGTPAYINVQADQANVGTIYIYDDTTDGWVSNGDYETPETIEVAVGHYYYVWVGGNVTYDVQSNHLVDPSTCPLDGGGQKAYGCAAASKTYSVHFTQTL
jgi:VCBS repeat-containing protein